MKYPFFLDLLHSFDLFLFSLGLIFCFSFLFQALCTAVSLLATVPLGELFFFHIILIRKVCLFISSFIPGFSVVYVHAYI